MGGTLRQNLSSDTLFHFVCKKEYLIDILENNFCARYCLERFPHPMGPIGIPIKCFCDIPLGAIKKHIIDYGKFGIGIKKSFAIENGITPVIYVHDNSATLINYLKAIDITKYKRPFDFKNPSLYFKIYEGYKIKNKKRRKVRYYDEREWRFIPEDPLVLAAPNITTLEENIKSNNKKLPPEYRLKFKISDINYLIVAKNREVKHLISEIRKIKRYHSEIEQDLLISKIITVQQIRGDF